jgi:hypothetical protein
MAKNVNFTIPYIPSADNEYSQQNLQQIVNSLRLYLTQLENHLRATDVEVDGSFTVSGEIEGGSLDINGNADISGTLTSVTYQGDEIANAYVANLPTSKITSGTFADARIAASNVTQHQGSITGTGALNSGSITSGFTSIDIGSGALTAGATTINGNFIINNDFMEIVSTTDSVIPMPIISLHRNGGAVADGSSDEIGAIKFYGQNENNEKKLFAGIYAEIGDTTDTDEVGELKFFLADGSGVDAAVTDVTTDETTVEDPVMSLFKYGLQLRQDNDFMLSYRGLLRFEGITNNSFETDFGVEDPTADRYVTLPDASGCLEIGSLASQAVITGTSIAHATMLTYKGQKIVFTGSSDLTIQLPDAAARGTITAGGSTPENQVGDVGATWTICNAGSANVILDLNGSGSAQTLKILTGAAVTDVGTDDPHIIPGGVASLICTAADNYILFGSGVVDN